MDQQVFKSNVFVAFILPAIISVVLVILFFAVDGIPPWILIFLIIPILMVVSGVKTKLVVEGGMLRYEKVFGGDEVSLKDVSRIITREVETFESTDRHGTGPGTPLTGSTSGITFGGAGNQQQSGERKIERIVYVMDETGRTFFSFPASLLGLQNRRRFIEAVTSSNPDIIVS